MLEKRGRMGGKIRRREQDGGNGIFFFQQKRPS